MATATMHGPFCQANGSKSKTVIKCSCKIKIQLVSGLDYFL